MKIPQSDIFQLSQFIWESTLGLEVRPIAASGFSAPGGRLVAGKVQITGAWLGAVILECSEELAKDVARIMFGLNSEEPTSEEIRDAVAEIANITAGNFKSLVGGQCHLLMPQVTHHVQEQLPSSEDVAIYRQAFDCQGEPFVVTILEGNTSGPLG
jgi:chemotaxis protein CheX